MTVSMQSLEYSSCLDAHPLDRSHVLKVLAAVQWVDLFPFPGPLALLT